MILDNILPSDSLQYAWGCKDHLPDELKWLWKRSTGDWQRLSLSINTYYPETTGHYYCNWRIVDTLYTALQDTGLVIVDRGYYEPLKTFPVEHLLAIDCYSAYLLLDHDRREVGALIKWKYSAGGGGDFFGDNLILDMLIAHDRAPRLLDAIKSTCSRARIRVHEAFPQ